MTTYKRLLLAAFLLTTINASAQVSPAGNAAPAANTAELREQIIAIIASKANDLAVFQSLSRERIAKMVDEQLAAVTVTAKDLAGDTRLEIVDRMMAAIAADLEKEKK